MRFECGPRACALEPVIDGRGRESGDFGQAAVGEPSHRIGQAGSHRWTSAGPCACNDRLSLRSPPDDDNCRVGGYLAVERRRVMHLDHDLNSERSRDHTPQPCTVCRPHPMIRADERQGTALFELT